MNLSDKFVSGFEVKGTRRLAEHSAVCHVPGMYPVGFTAPPLPLPWGLRCLEHGFPNTQPQEPCHPHSPH